MELDIVDYVFFAIIASAVLLVINSIFMGV